MQANSINVFFRNHHFFISRNVSVYCANKTEFTDSANDFIYIYTYLNIQTARYIL